jgi:hypothetical protein
MPGGGAPTCTTSAGANLGAGAPPDAAPATVEDCPSRLLVASLLSTAFAAVDVSYAAPQAHEIVNVALHQEYSPGIIFIFSYGRKDLYHV